MNKDATAWKKMEEYNKGDVELLEGIYTAFRPWIKNHPNLALYNTVDGHTCPHCGDGALVKRGYSYTTTGRYQRYRCSACGTWSRDRKGVQHQPELVGDKT